MRTDERYAVEWCSEIPTDPETGESDIDAAKYHVECFKDEATALKRAAELYPLDAFGSVIVTRQEARLDPYISRAIGRRHYEWENVAVLYFDDAAHVYTERDWERL